MLLFIDNFRLSEGLLIAIVAVIVFGKRLPQVAGQVASHIGRARRALDSLWRESGIEEEVQRARREVDRVRRELPERGAIARGFEAERARPTATLPAPRSEPLIASPGPSQDPSHGPSPAAPHGPSPGPSPVPPTDEG